MGVLRFYLALATTLIRDSQQVTTAPLDELAAAYSDFAYIGNRKSLESLVRSEATQLKERLEAINRKVIARHKLREPEIVSLVEVVRATDDPAHVIQNWLGRDWIKDSGVFPDFLLGSDVNETLGNGALLELKDSKEASIASFNSTIPTRYKSFDNPHRPH